MEKQNKKQRRKNIFWTVTLSVLSGLVFGLSVMLYTQYNAASNYAASLEANYQKSYFDLNDKINNMEIKLSKVVSSTSPSYSAKMLNEISKNAEDAQSNLNLLPISMNGVEESLAFINKVGGYTGTLAKKLNKGEILTEQEVQTLEKLHQSVLKMKQSMQKMTEDMWNGYSILQNGLSFKGDHNQFTVSLQSLNAGDVEYPTMIYDGPFSDSQLKKQAKGLTENYVSEEQALSNLSELMDIPKDSIKLAGDAKSYFETYDFSFEKSNMNFYAQMTKKGGKLLTMASYNDSSAVTINREQAKQIAAQFVEKAGIKDMECVWSDVVAKDAYFNFAPVVNGVIIYPDLVKVKVDLAHGEVVGFEAKSYYTNHQDRSIGNFAISAEQARKQVKNGYVIKQNSKALAPIDFEEVLCWEFETLNNGNIYYFYVDAQTGQLVNVLRVIKTNDGSKLM
jgi:spore germination protein